MSAKYNTAVPRVAVIGCGNWGKNHIRVFHELGALSAVYDIDVQKAKLFSEQYGVKALTLAELLHSSEIDAVVIATPSVTHESFATQCLNANKHVFIEKPHALNVKASNTLNKLAKQQNKILMVGHLLQYHEVFATLRRLNQEGRFGKLQYIYSHRLNLGKFLSEPSVLWDYAPHDISMILALMGDMPLQINAQGGKHLQHTTLDTACIQLNFPHNRQAHLYLSWLHPFKEQKLTVIGEKAMAVFDDTKPWEEKLTLLTYPQKWVDGLPHPFVADSHKVSVTLSEPLKNECQHFLQAIQADTQPITNGNEGSRVIEVLQATELAIKSNIGVTLPLEHSEAFRKATQLQATLDPAGSLVTTEI